MVINSLVDAVASFCEKVVVNLMQPVPDRVTEMRPGSLKRTELIQIDQSMPDVKHISVFKGCLPPKRQSENDDYPFVLVVPVSGTVKKEESLTNINIFCGSWHEGTDGYAEVLNTVQRILISLSQLHEALDHRYVLTDLKWVFPDVSSQAGAPKMWQALISTEWRYRAPTNNLPDDTQFF